MIKISFIDFTNVVNVVNNVNDVIIMKVTQYSK